MAFPTPSLDDRTAQQIVDQAKRLIPTFCPEWTDHNVSDPGVALIELFAWMTELLLYRVNQVPDRMYVRFLEMLGIQLQPPHPATVELTFYTSKPLVGNLGISAIPGRQETEITIQGDTEVATARSEEAAPIIFTTEKSVTLRSPIVSGAFTADASRPTEPLAEHRLELVNTPDSQEVIGVFPQPAGDDDGFYLRLVNNHSFNYLVLIVTVQEQSGATDIKPQSPPWRWEVSQEGSGWSACELFLDTTGGFSNNGEIHLFLPATDPGAVHDKQGYWLRTVVRGQTPNNQYSVTPRLTSLRVEVRGATTLAANAITVRDELLGRSSGAPGQIFRLQHRPVLPLPVVDDNVLRISGREGISTWRPVADFAESGPEDRVFALDYLDGTIRMPPAVLQPNGSIRSYGAQPEPDCEVVMARYQYWGEHVGQLKAGSLTVLRSTIQYIARVENRSPSTEGLGPELPEDARIRAPQRLRTLTRAVTAQDYEYWAGQVFGVARACCLHAGEHKKSDPARPQPGYVEVRVLPRADDPLAPLAGGQPALDKELREAVLNRLNELRPLGIALDVQHARLIPVQVTAKVRPEQHLTGDERTELQLRAQMVLDRFLNPYIGGPDQKGWPFGRTVYFSELYSRLEQVPGVGVVEELTISANDQEVRGNRLPVPVGTVVCSRSHEVTVLPEPA